MPYSAHTKDPQAVETLTLDWSPYLATGETITTSTWPTQPSGITVNSTSNTTTAARITLAGGTNNRDYYFVNHVVTNLGEYDWNLKVRVYQFSTVPGGPPYASVYEAQAFQPGAEGEEPLKVEATLRQASRMVAKFAPRPAAITTTLSSAMDATQTTIPVAKVEVFPESGIVRIDDELLTYFTPSATVGSTGPGTLDNATRAYEATLPASHLSGATVTEVSYPLLARDAELSVFEWLWDTRGYKPSRSGVIGSESYNIDFAQIKALVKETMGHFYTGGGRVRSVPVTSEFPRRYNHRNPEWIGNG